MSHARATLTDYSSTPAILSYSSLVPRRQGAGRRPTQGSPHTLLRADKGSNSEMISTPKYRLPPTSAPPLTEQQRRLGPTPPPTQSPSTNAASDKRPRSRLLRPTMTPRRPRRRLRPTPPPLQFPTWVVPDAVSTEVSDQRRHQRHLRPPPSQPATPSNDVASQRQLYERRLVQRCLRRKRLHACKCTTGYTLEHVAWQLGTLLCR